MSYVYLLLLSCLTLVKAQEYVRVCYYTNWAQYRPSPMKYVPTDIDPSLCTHVIFAFAKIGDDHTLQTYEWNDEVMYGKLNELKQVKL
jgi:chitinase